MDDSNNWLPANFARSSHLSEFQRLPTTYQLEASGVITGSTESGVGHNGCDSDLRLIASRRTLTYISHDPLFVSATCSGEPEFDINQIVGRGILASSYFCE